MNFIKWKSEDIAIKVAQWNTNCAKSVFCRIDDGTTSSSSGAAGLVTWQKIRDRVPTDLIEQIIGRDDDRIMLSRLLIHVHEHSVAPPL